mgnify:CR=1 FL=1
MMYDEKKIECLKERYPEGTRICLDQMNDDPFPVESGTFGKVDHVDDIGRRGRFSRYQRRIGTN